MEIASVQMEGAWPSVKGDLKTKTDHSFLVCPLHPPELAERVIQGVTREV